MRYYTLNITRAFLREGKESYAATPENIVKYALEYCYEKKDLWREQSFLIFMNNSNLIEGHYLLGMGGTDSVTMDKRLACMAMLGANATRAVLVHNHPSGNPAPGQSDLLVTEEIKKAFAAIGCNLLDHVIIGDDEHFSYCQEKKFKVKSDPHED